MMYNLHKGERSSFLLEMYFILYYNVLFFFYLFDTFLCYTYNRIKVLHFAPS